MLVINIDGFMYGKMSNYILLYIWLLPKFVKTITADYYFLVIKGIFGWSPGWTKRIYAVIAWVIWNIDPVKLNELCAIVVTILQRIPCSLFLLLSLSTHTQRCPHSKWMHASGPFNEMKQNKTKNGRIANVNKNTT